MNTRPLIIAVVLMAAATAAVAADPDATLRTALADLDPVLATGRLADRAVPVAGLHRFDGSPEAPAADAVTWRQILHELRLASSTPPPWPTGAALRAMADAQQSHDLVPLAFLDLAYESLRPDVLAAGHLRPDGDRLAPDPTATAADLVDRRRVTAAAALTRGIHGGEHTSFVLPSDLLVAEEPLTLSIDLADGAGFRPVRPDAPIVAHYHATGPRQIRVRAETTTGEVRHARFDVDVVTLVVPDPSAVWPLTASISHGGAAASGEAFVYLADGHAAVTDPVIVVEGFDLDNSLNWPELYDLLNQENLIEDLRAAGRDAIVLNFAEATDPIQRNAYLLVELLQTVDAQLPPGASYPIVGASMGGLVTRYALTWLEHSGAGHQCETFLSFDVPHVGADIPLGMQTWLDFFQGESDEAAYNLSRLNTTAARQMLLYHHTALSGTTAAPSPDRTAFLADLAAIGDWPAQPRLVAAVNGNGLGGSQGFAAGAQVILWEYGSVLVDINGNVWAVPDGGTQIIFHGLIDLIWPLPDTERYVTVSGTLPWDGAPGGYRTTFADLDATEVPYGDLHALHPNHAFIPTVSALGLVGASPFMDLQAEPDLLGLTPFESIFVPAANEPHVTVTALSHDWIIDELLGVTAVGDPTATLMATLRLHGAAPNPFNPRTEIAFALPGSGPARLWISDARGRRVRTLVSADLPAGEHRAIWNGRDDTGRAVATGVYLAVVEQAGGRVARRLTLVR